MFPKEVGSWVRRWTWLLAVKREPPRSKALSPEPVEKRSPNPDPVLPNHKTPEQRRQEYREACRNGAYGLCMANFYDAYPEETPPGFWEAFRPEPIKAAERKAQKRNQIIEQSNDLEQSMGL